ncbi:hypothetical protein ACFXEL_13505 [Streptomyces sp. NPDC059382]
MTERVVLAHAGGPDTSAAIGRLAEETGHPRTRPRPRCRPSEIAARRDLA